MFGSRGSSWSGRSIRTKNAARLVAREARLLAMTTDPNFGVIRGAATRSVTSAGGHSGKPM